MTNQSGAPRTAAGRDFLSWWQGREYVTVTLDWATASVELIEAAATAEAERLLAALVEPMLAEWEGGIVDNVTRRDGWAALEEARVYLTERDVQKETP